MFKNKGIAFKLILFTLFANLLVYSVAFYYNYIFSKEIILEKIQDNVDKLYKTTAEKVNSVFQSVEKSVQNAAFMLENGDYDEEGINELINSILINNDEIYGSTISFAPFAFKEKESYAPYFYRKDGMIVFDNLDKDGYNYFTHDWYQLPRLLNRALWSEPYYDFAGGDALMATYSIPIYKDMNGKRTFNGVITGDISLTWLQKLVNSIHIGKTGYAFILSKNGKFVSHPDTSIILNESIFSIAEEENDTLLRNIGRKMISGQSGMYIIQSPVDDKEKYLFFTHFPINDWSIAVVINSNEVFADISRLNHIVFIVTTLGLIFIALFIILITKKFTEPLKKLTKVTNEISKGNLDFILEPVDTKDEIGRLNNSFILMRDSLKRHIKELKNTTAAKERIESELNIAHDIQMSMLPVNFPKQERFGLHALLKPAKEVGGDLYDFFFLDGDTFCFVVGDVSGKGVPAALFMSITKTLIKAYAAKHLSPQETIKRVNKELVFQNSKMLFVTLFYGAIDLSTGKIRYVNAGHNPPLIKNETVEYLEVRPNIPLGIDDSFDFEGDEFRLDKGESVILYTDGVTEAQNKNQELFSEEKLQNDAIKIDSSDPEVLLTEIYNSVVNFTGESPQFDDITLLTLNYKGEIR